VGYVRPLALAAGLGLGACTTTGDVLDANGGSGSESGGSDTSVGGVEGSTSGDDLGPCGDNGGAWCPMPGTTWQVQRIGALDTTEVAEIYDVALFTIDLAGVSTLHNAERSVVCWFSAGISTWSDPDRDTVYPATGPDIVPNQPERWMDHGNPIVRDAMVARIDQAAALGCDAIEPGDLDGYLVDSGLPLTREGTIEYVELLAAEAHARGLAIALSDGNELAADLEPSLDFAIDFGCLAADTCDRLAPFADAGKLVLHAEIIPAEMVYDVENMAPEMCAESEALSMVSIFKKPDLGFWRYPCG
jgi:hypothetical protein